MTITKPDGTIETKGPTNSDAVGAGFFVYYPSIVGTYKFQMHYAGGQDVVYAGDFFTARTNTTFLASDSMIATLTVQEAAVTNPATAPLPTSYWTRPINGGENLNWAQISGNWLMAGWNSTSRGFDSGIAQTPEGVVPNTAHILWTKPMTFGGLVGGRAGVTSFTDGRSYEYFFKPPVVISGRLYYNTIAAEEPRTIGDMGNLGIVCVDMETGQTLFTIANQTLSFGQIYTYNSPNQAGALAYLWTTNNRIYDAWTGNYILSLTAMPSGATTFGADGSIIIYSINAAAGTISKWNSSKAIPPAGDVGPGLAPVWGTSNSWQWRIYNYAGYTINATGTTVLPNSDVFGPPTLRLTNGTEWTAPLIAGVPGQGLSNFIQSAMYEGNAILTISGGDTFCAYSLTNGAALWGPVKLQVPTSLPAQDALTGIGAFQNCWESNGVYYTFVKGTLQWVAYDVSTGQVKWISEPYTNAWGMYVPSVNFFNNTFYSAGYDGILRAYNADNGQLKWTFSSGNAGTLTPYGSWPLYSGITIADGKLFVTTSEHGNGVEPLYQGEHLFVVDANTGKQVWNMSGWFEQMVIADGKVVSHNCYDNQLYAFGKGSSATTIEAPLAAINKGSSLIIQGTVTDQSVGAKGTPAISDADMSAWMAYMYSQQPLPSNAKGVPVKLMAIDPNGNTQDIGTVTSDLAGNYVTMWTPPVEGLYTVIATFEGSNAYYGSYAETHIAVQLAPSAAPTATSTPTEAPTATPTVAPTASPSPAPNPETGPSTDMYIIAAAAVVVIVVVAVAAVFLRKRK